MDSTNKPYNHHHHHHHHPHLPHPHPHPHHPHPHPHPQISLSQSPKFLLLTASTFYQGSLPLHPTVPGTRGYATTEPMTLPSGLLVSGGAKGALKAHLVSGDALLGVWCTSLGQVDPVKVEMLGGS